MLRPALRVLRKGSLALSSGSLTELLSAVLAGGRSLRFRARGLSMAPFIKDGDIVTVAPFGSAGPRTGDIAAFLHPATGKVAVHRIVRAEPGRFLLKGDNLEESDGAVPAERMLGLVTRVERNGAVVRAAPLGGAVVARMSRSGCLRKAVGAARRAGFRTRKRS